MKQRFVQLLALGHFVTDINQGALPALLPFLISTHHISYTAAAGIVFAANMTSTVVQPLFGYGADRFAKPWILCVGIFLAGAGLGGIGLFADYLSIFLLAAVSGIGIAAFHPQAARLVHLAAGQRTATAMSIFGIGGTMGFAAGPLLVTAAVLNSGLEGTLWLVLPTSAMALLMVARYDQLTRLEKDAPVAQTTKGNRAVDDEWGPFMRLTVVVVGRSMMFYGLNTFIPLYWIHVLGCSPAMGGTALTVMSVSGIAGNLIGGKLADRWGLKRIMVLGFGLLIVLLPLLVWVKNSWFALLLLVPIGLCLFATYSPTIVLGQRYLPSRIGFSSGITIGVAVAIGGAVAPLLGRLADSYDVWSAVAAVALLPLPIVLLSLFLPLPGAMRRD